eukprot:1155290-Pelagomonas_calceolata.AAC.1
MPLRCLYTLATHPEFQVEVRQELKQAGLLHGRKEEGKGFKVRENKICGFKIWKLGRTICQAEGQRWNGSLFGS